MPRCTRRWPTLGCRRIRSVSSIVAARACHAEGTACDTCAGYNCDPANRTDGYGIVTALVQRKPDRAVDRARIAVATARRSRACSKYQPCRDLRVAQALRGIEHIRARCPSRNGSFSARAIRLSLARSTSESSIRAKRDVTTNVRHAPPRLLHRRENELSADTTSYLGSARQSVRQGRGQRNQTCDATPWLA